jgi:signal transduction histidine kinase
VMERFYRGDASRGTPGVGLGLSLVQAVAKLHGSALELSDQTPGLRVALTLPLEAASPVALATPPQAAAAGDVIVSATLVSS